MRLFVAVDLDPDIRRRIEEVQHEMAEPGLNTIASNNLHVTLKFLGDVDEAKTESIKKRLAAIKMAAFDIELKGIGVFPSENYIRVVWVGMEGPIGKLADAVRDALPEFSDDYPFSGHLTIFRVKTKPSGLKDNLRKLKDVNIGTQHVMEFKLKKSTLTRNGAIYEDMKVFGLEK